jgi:hypothetical protein
MEPFLALPRQVVAPLAEDNGVAGLRAGESSCEAVTRADPHGRKKVRQRRCALRPPCNEHVYVL